MSNVIASRYAEKERIKLLKKAQRNLYWLSTEVLEQGFIVGPWHQPMLSEWDDRRRVWRRGNALEELEMWMRDSGKTTCRKAQVIQDYLHDPFTTHIWWHAVEARAQDEVVDIGKMLQSNKVLRKIMGEYAPLPISRARKWVTAAGFNLPCKHRAGGPPSMRAFGAGSEATGGHCDIGEIDDCIGENTIEDNLMPKIRRWLGSTVRNVVRTRNPWFRFTGTHWEVDDIYADLRAKSRCQVRVRAAYETDGVPDWNGEPQLFTRQEIEYKRAGMTAYQFSCQMMNTPLPSSERLWDKDNCEHFRSVAECAEIKGRNFVLSDPAPSGISRAKDVEKKRRDALKNFWSTAVVRVGVYRGGIPVIALLDGRHSQDWSTDQGFDVACELLRKWQTNMLYLEAYGGLSKNWSEDAWRARTRNGCDIFFDRDRQLPKFADSYGSGAKNQRIERLSSKAAREEFWICESCPDEFLYGDGEKSGFLTQMRRFRDVGKGRNNLVFDDDADATARGTDGALQRWVPQPRMPVDLPGMGPYQRQKKSTPNWGGRYIRYER